MHKAKGGPSMDREVIEAKALKILADSTGLRAPVDVIAVTRSQGVDVLEGTFDDDISGMVTKDGSRVTIYVNRLHPPVRKRFTVAHELGHHVLGHLHGDKAVHEDDNGRLFLFRSSDAAGWPEEVEANQFAAALLMPRPLLMAAVEETPKPVDPSALATRFWVSEAAMTIRLQTLFPHLAGTLA
jgi:Zn-dependent peptidase ImmA (M78 family)